MSLSVVILAAGQGTRMNSKVPKVLHGISGLPMIHHIIKTAEEVSDDITVILSYRADMIKEYIKNNFEGINFQMQNIKYPGTGGALMEYVPKYKRVLVLNGDMPLISKEDIEPIINEKADIVLGVYDLRNPTGYGRVIIYNDKVQSIVEEKDCLPEQKSIKTVNSGVYLFKYNILKKYLPNLSKNNTQKEYYLTDIIRMARIDNMLIKAIWVSDEAFKGVNTRYDLSEAEELMQKKIKRKWMHKGVTMRFPSTIYIDSRANFVGECKLESGVTIYGNSTIESSYIKTHTVIEDATIVNSKCGPLARIRPGTILINSDIGNFVEIKNSQLKGVKAGHLSYLGDSEIDEGTNIGAGAITCNYDGKKKHKTKIGKNVFVGSDTQLVAPITIEDNVIIAAGTTVTEDIKSGELAISRTPLKKVKDFFYKFFMKEKADG